MKIFNGKKEAEKILSDLKKKTTKYKEKPKLAVISTGSDPASELFIRNKKRAAKKAGIEVIRCKLKKEKEILKKIRDFNKEKEISGIIVQLPLPKKFNTNKIIKEISSKKDVDGLGENSPFSSPFITAIEIALKEALKKIKNKKILALVNSDIFGRKLRDFFKKKKIKIDYFLKKKSYPRNKIKEADIIITACGVPNQIEGKYIKEKVILIDGGITLLKNKKIVGDVNKKRLKNKPSFLTPVPGGIGPLTVALLLKNTLIGFKKYGKHS